MCLFFESIKVFQGKAVNLDLHESRMNRTRLELLGFTEKLSLEHLRHTDVKSLQKCRVIYKEKIEKTEYIPYSPKLVDHLKIVYANNLRYEYKFLDRTCIDELLIGIPPGTDILIVKNDKITDTSYANIVFWDGTSWLTPAEPLLAGTKRGSLLRKGLIHIAEIRVQDLHLFKCAAMINALLDLEDSPVIEIKRELMPSWQKTFKRIIDVVGSLLFILILSPVYLATALGVKLSSKGPIIYSQERIGIHGKPFKMYKFRSIAFDT